MNAQDIINSIPAARMKPAVNEGDYRGEDGLLHCGKCGTPKETRINNRLQFCLCECRERERSEQESKKKAAERETLRKSCFPREAMMSSRFETAERVVHIRRAQKYVSNWDEFSSKGIGLSFWGNVGTGKSFAAQCIANALIDMGIRAKYITAANLIEEYTDTKTDRKAYIDKLCSVPLLIIDDIGAERDTSFAREKLCSIIDSRIESRRPLIVTTNYSLEEMKNAEDITLQRVFDRLSGYCIPVKVVGESRRKIAAAENLRYAMSILGD